MYSYKFKGIYWEYMFIPASMVELTGRYRLFNYLMQIEVKYIVRYRLLWIKPKYVVTWVNEEDVRFIETPKWETFECNKDK